MTTDSMICRACEKEERASEGYPCDKCGTFICVICFFKNVIRCKECTVKFGAADSTENA